MEARFKLQFLVMHPLDTMVSFHLVRYQCLVHKVNASTIGSTMAVLPLSEHDIYLSFFLPSICPAYNLTLSNS